MMKQHIPLWEDLIRILDIKDIDQFDALWSRVDKIFNPFFGYSPSSPIVALMIQTESVTYTEAITEIRIPSNYRHIATSPTEETDKHLILKHTAYCILTELGANDVMFEYNYWDVYSDKLKIRIECGHTDPNRLIDFLHANEDSLFWVLSYPKTGNTHTTMHKFEANEKTRKFTELYQKRRIELAFMRRRARLKEEPWNVCPEKLLDIGYIGGITDETWPSC